MENIKRVDAFLTAAGGCFLSTAEDGRPHDRPLGFHLMRGDRIYFLLTNRKDVYYQMRRNPQVEVTARKGKDWLRYYGKAVFEPDYSLAETLMRAVPQLKDLYGEDAGERLEIFHLEDATVEFRNMTLLNERFALNDTGAKRSEDIGYTLGLANPVKLKERIEAGQFLVYYQPQISLQTERRGGGSGPLRRREGDVLPAGRLHPRAGEGEGDLPRGLLRLRARLPKAEGVERPGPSRGPGVHKLFPVHRRGGAVR